MQIEMLPYLLLLLAILTGWLSEIRFSLFLIGLAFAAAIAFGELTRNFPIYQNVQFSADSIHFSMDLNFALTTVGLLIYLFFLKPNQAATFGKNEFLVTLKTLGALSSLIFGIVLSIGYVRYDLKFPPRGWFWVLNNLFFVCLAEEAIFRGLIQKSIAKILPKTKTFTVLSVVLASALFGLAHYQGGPQLMGLAAVAGLFFGYAYQRTNRIESSMLVHFGLNVIHFVFFSYPALIR